MKSREENVVLCKSYAFSLRCVKLYKFLCSRDGNYIIGKQLLRSGTSIGANCREAARGQSKADFVAKMNIALKEADETAYRLELLYATDFVTQVQFQSIYNDAEELIKVW